MAKFKKLHTAGSSSTTRTFGREGSSIGLFRERALKEGSGLPLQAPGNELLQVPSK
jgi:hypothetical protein